MKIVCLIVLSASLLSCLTKTKRESQSIVAKNTDTFFISKDSVKQPSLVKVISQLNTDTCATHWHGGGLFSLCFEKNRVIFFFTAQCIYWYKTKLENNKLIFFWDYNEDCVFDRGLKNNYGIKNHPSVGSPFGEFTLINDTTLHVKYYYPDWVKKVNEHANDVDTLFPIIFKMKRK